MAEIKRVKLSLVDPSPYRRIDKYPIKPEKVKVLASSIEATGFWDGYIWMRPVGNRFELAFGHHRLAALKEAGETHVFAMIGDLDEQRMLQMLANENSERFATSFYWSVMEPIEAVVKAYGSGAIELDKPATGKGVRRDSLRVAPSFVQGKVEGDTWEKTYSAVTVATYLGWTNHNKDRVVQASDRVLIALSALELIERGAFKREDIWELSQAQVSRLIKLHAVVHKVSTTAEDVKVRSLETRRDAFKAKGENDKAAEVDAQIKSAEKKIEKKAREAAAKAVQTAADVLDHNGSVDEALDAAASKWGDAAKRQLGLVDKVDTKSEATTRDKTFTLIGKLESVGLHEHWKAYTDAARKSKPLYIHDLVKAARDAAARLNSRVEELEEAMK